MDLLQELTKTPTKEAAQKLRTNLLILTNLSIQDIPGTSETETLVKAGILLKSKKYQETVQFIETNYDLLTTSRHTDFHTSVIICFYYLALKKLNIQNPIFFKLLENNREIWNKECVAMLINIILDMLITNNMYKEASLFIQQTNPHSNPNPILENNPRFNYYKGVIHLVAKEYTEALECFQTASLSATKKTFLLKLDKLILLCLTLKAEFPTANFSWKKGLKAYYELLKGVKSGNIHIFEKAFNKHKAVFIKDKVYTIAQRLHQNVVQEGIRKISLVYSRISFKDISVFVGMDYEDVRFLLMKNIKNGSVSGYIEDDVYFSERGQKAQVDVGRKTRECIMLCSTICGLMKYPESEKLSFDTISKDDRYSDYNM